MDAGRVRESNNFNWLRVRAPAKWTAQRPYALPESKKERRKKSLHSLARQLD